MNRRKLLQIIGGALPFALVKTISAKSPAAAETFGFKNFAVQSPDIGIGGTVEGLTAEIAKAMDHLSDALNDGIKKRTAPIQHIRISFHNIPSEKYNPNCDLGFFRGILVSGPPIDAMPNGTVELKQPPNWNQ